MSFRLLLPLVLLAFSTAVNAQVQLKPNTTKAEEHKTYHLPSIRPMPAAMRLEHYRKRQQMEAASPFLGVKWRPIGPEIQGGRVIEIKVPRNQPNTMFFAYATGGLWKSSDQGVTWTSLFENESAFAIGSIDVTADGRTIWIGTGENNSQRTSYSGTGMFKSSDAGATWQHMGLAETHRIGRVIIDPKNPNTVYVGAIGALYSQNPERGVFKTTDGGRTWSHVLKLDDYTGVIDMAMDPRNPSVIYASSWERDRRAWNFREGGAGSTIYKTVDGGKTWSELKNGLPKRGEIGRIGLAVSGSRPDTVYAFYDNQGSDEDTLFHDESQPTGTLTARRFALLNEEQFVAIDTAVLNRFASAYLPQGTKVEEIVQKIKAKTMTLKDVADLIEKRNPAALRQVTVEAEVYRSDDGGKSWRRTHARRLGEHGGYYGGRVIVNPHNPDDLLITGVLMLRSRDGGKTWSSVATQVHVDHHAYWIDPTNPNNHAIGNDGGLYLSFDDGKNWRHMNNMNVGQFTTIAVDNKLPYNVYGGLQDNGTLKGPSTYVFGRNRIHDWSAIGGGDGSALAVDPRDDGDLVYGAWQFGMHYAINQKTNQRWNLRPSAKTGEPALRFNWISPILISPHHPDIIYLGSQKLHRSMSQGRAWEDLSGDLTKNLPNGDV
ncbi:MAG TPA: YCF48-related protein, partial [Fimbriimonadaceae bacterium]|nr:YCF48-related protein [Fimbriimonadaceae bacterium]